jgi:transposase
MSKPGTGRPSKYDPAYCDQIIDFMANGYSVAAFAGSIRVARRTVYNWAEEHPEFMHALQTAQASSALWWERQAMHTAATGEGNAALCIFGLKNRVADEWRDRQAIEHTGADGGPVQTRITIERTIVDP